LRAPIRFDIQFAVHVSEQREAPVALRVSGIDFAYGQLQVLFGISLEVHEGEALALLGTNGAGKSTLLRVISGLEKPALGTVSYFGENITGVPAERLPARGLLLVVGGRAVFTDMSVQENLHMQAFAARMDKSRLNERREVVYETFPALAARRRQKAGNLSGGEQQQLAVAKALLLDPKVLCIDEMSLGLAPIVVSELLEVVRRIHATGVTLIVVEQSLNIAAEICKRAVFLEKGEVRFSGAAAELLERPDILRSVFIAGSAAADDTAAKAPARPSRRRSGARVAPGPDTPAVLECRGLTKRFGGIRAVGEVDLSLRDGEILGLIGHNGAGKTTLFDLISGFLAHDEGRLLLGGSDMSEWPAHHRAAAGLGRSFQEARLFPSLTVAETIAYLTRRGVPVMGHVGLRPQAVLTDGAFKAKGRDGADHAGVIAEAKAAADAGAFCVVVEGVAEALARQITAAIDVPTIGIGASAGCDGQILVTDDMLGLFDWTPKFVRRYADLKGEIGRAARAYADDVRSGAFPALAETYFAKVKERRPA